MAARLMDAQTLSAWLPTYVGDEAPLLEDHEADAIITIADDLFAREQFARAASLFRMLALFRPPEARLWLALAACHHALGDAGHAFVLFQVAAAAPGRLEDRLSAHLHLARRFLEQGRADDAEPHVTAVLSLGTNLGANQRELAAEVGVVLAAFERTAQ